MRRKIFITTLCLFFLLTPINAQAENLYGYKMTFDKKYSDLIMNISLMEIGLFTMISIFLIIKCNQQKKTNEKLNHTIRYDTLTNIYNRGVFSKDLESSIEKGSPFAILMYDLDNFKHINDLYGHNQGDMVLKEVARRVSGINDDIFQVYRLAGDEFMAIVKSVDEGVVENYARLIQKQMMIPFVLNGKEHILHSSIGVAMWPADGGDETSLVAAADKAMYYVKNHGKENVEFYHKYIRYDEQMKLLQEVDKSELESRIFDGFSRTSNRRYIFICNMQTGITRFSSNAVEYFGLSGEYLTNAGAIFEKIIHPDYRKKYVDSLEAVFTGKNDKSIGDYRLRNKSGDYVVCTLQSLVLKGEDGKPDLYLGAIENHSILDNVDPVTNLYNCVEFWKTLTNWKEGRICGTVLQMGIRNFSEINKNYGYSNGDKVLRNVADEMQKIIGNRGELFRMDGVTFAVCTTINNKAFIKELYNDICYKVRHNIFIGNTRIAVHLAGGAVQSEGQIEEHSILTSARYAMEKSKYSNNGEIIFFDDKVFGKDKKNLEMLAKLRECVLNDFEGFYLCYQPLFSAKTEELIGAEALIRWEDSEYGYISPEVFMPWIENDPIFADLGTWILRQAMEQGLKFVENNPDFILNVNITYPQISKPGFKKVVRNILDETGFPPANLCMELTERCRQLEQDKLIKATNYFKSLGIKIAIDDFGTGYSSLNLLSALSVDTLKFDKGFTKDLKTNLVNQNIIQAITECAEKMKIKVCLEGMENRELIDFSKRYNVYSYQGFYFSKPISYDDFMEKYVLTC